MVLRTRFITYLMVSVMLCPKTGSVCPYSWQLNRNKSSCFVNCNEATTATAYEENVNCKLLPLSGFTKYDSTQNVLEMPRGKSLISKKALDLPHCYNVTLTSGEYSVTATGQYELNANVPLVSNFNVQVNDDDSISVCYPLSPQLLQCKKHTIKPQHYQLIKRTLLRIPSKNMTAYLGDFYIDDKGIAYTCSEGVIYPLRLIPRCNFVKLQSNEYVITKDGSLFIPEAKFTIKHPLYSFMLNNISVICVPLRIDYINCPKVIISPFQEHLQSNLIVYSSLVEKYYLPDSYYFMDDDLVAICLNRDDTTVEPIVTTVSTIETWFNAGSAIFLFLTFLLKIQCFKSNYHTRCFLLHILCLMVMYIATCVKMLVEVENIFGCYMLFSVLYYSYMAAFFWLNVIAYDSWRTFVKLQTSPYHCSGLCGCMKPISNERRFIFYNIYVWGMALLLITITLIIDLSPMPDNISFLNPQIDYFCWFNNPASIGVYYYGPLGVLMFFNLIFFVMTIHIIYHASKGTKLVNHQRKKQSLEIAIKLFTSMGLAWTTDVVCYSLSSFDTPNFHTWFVSNAIIGLQGVFIFFIYFAKKELLFSFSLFIRLSFIRRAFLTNNDNVPLRKVVFSNIYNPQLTKGFD